MSRKWAIENKLGEGIPEMEGQIVVVIYHLSVNIYRKVTAETWASGYGWFQKLKVSEERGQDLEGPALGMHQR